MEKVRFDELNAHLQELLQGRDWRGLRRWAEELHPADVAELIDELEAKDAVWVFRALSKSQAAEVFAFIEPEGQEALINGISDREISRVVDSLFVDDAVDLLEELPANIVAKVLRLAAPETRETLNHFLKYPEDSAGSLMTSEYIRLREGMRIGEAIGYIRRHGAEAETLYTCYITSEDRKLKGLISMRTLLLAKDEEAVEDLMEDQLIVARTTDDKELVMKLFGTYDLLALPVVDGEFRLVGIITVDDVIDVVHEEATEDFELMAAIRPSDKSYFKMGVLEQSKNRIVWLLILMISGMLNGSILAKYEHAFLAVPLLVTFVPMLTDTGGNSGAQSSTMIIRGMALDEIRFSDIWRVIWKELRISLLVGSVLALANFARIYFFMGRNFSVALAVSLTLLAVVTLAKLMGSTLPLIARKIKLDPAIMAAPLITTIVDACALVVFFTLSVMILHI